MKKALLLICLLMPFIAHAQFCGYTYHAPIATATNGSTISGDSLTSISLTGVSNVHITKCKVANKATGIAIFLLNCTNITIDSCIVENVQQGIIAQNCTNTIIQNNYIHNVFGAPLHTYHPIQFIGCTRGRINYNKILEDPATTPYTHDQISLYQSNGVVGDSIQVIGNWVRGGQQTMNGSGAGGFVGGNNGATGINLGDSGGSYQVARRNLVINGGYIGMQVDAKGTSLKMDHNSVYTSRTNISLVGISYYTTGSTPGPSSNYIGYNKINWARNSGGTYNKYYNPSLIRPNGWATNSGDSSPDAAANSTMIPTPMVTACSAPVLTAPHITYSTRSQSGTYGIALTPMVAVNTGGAVVSWGVGALPTGVSFAAGTISGTPRQVGTFVISISATNSAGTSRDTVTLVIAKKNLTISAISTSKQQGQGNPALQYSYNGGLVNGDTSVAGVSVSTTAVTGSPVGSYAISLSGASSAVYNITLIPGSLTVYSGVLIIGYTAVIL